MVKYSRRAVEFSGLLSSDPDGSIVAYVWSFGDGSSADTAEPTHTYQQAGSHTARCGGTTQAPSAVLTVITPVRA